MRHQLSLELRTALGAILAVASVTLWPSPSLALRRPEPPQAFKIRSIDGWIGGGYEFKDELTKRPGRSDVTELDETEREFFEELNVGGTASIYHPRFLLIDGHILVRMEQGQREVNFSSAEQGDRDGLINEYNLNLDILPLHPYSLRLFGSRYNTDVAAEFFPDYDVTTDRAGARLRWRNKWFPMSLSVVRSESVGKGGADHIDDETRNLTYRVEQKRRGRRSSFEYEWEDREDRRARTNVNTQRAYLTNVISFGPENRSLFHNLIYFLDQGGSLQHQVLSGSADLLLRHRPSFQTHYNYEGRVTDTELERSVFNEGEVGFRHQLYRNLTTSFDVGGYADDTDTGETIEPRTRLDLDYVRSIPYGSIAVASHIGYRLRDENFTTMVGQILDEPHTFDASNAVSLRSEFVRTSTVVVTDVSGLTIFVEDVDYRIQVIGTLTEIVRLIGGTIPGGGSVSVDYEFERPRNRRFSTIDHGVLLSLSLFKSLRLYGSYSRWDRHLIDGVDLGGEDDISDRIVGASLNRWGLFLIAEREDYVSEINSRLTDRLNANFTLRLPLRSLLRTSASWSHTDFPNTKELTNNPNARDFSEVLAFEGRLTVKPIRNLAIEGGVRLRDEEGRVESQEKVFFGELHLRIRNVEVIVKGERRREEDRGGVDLGFLDERDRDLINAEIIRRF